MAMLRRSGLALAMGALTLGSGALAARGDDRAQDVRLAALAAELKEPAGFRAACKLVDAGPAALDDLLNQLGTSRLADERIEACVREIARTPEGAKAAIQRLGKAARPVTRARLARALAQAGSVDAVYPIVDALDQVQEPLEVSTFGPQGQPARDTVRIARPVSSAAASFGARAARAIRKRLAGTSSSLFRVEAARTLGAIGGPEVVPDLVALASSEDRAPSEREAALAALASIGNVPAARDAFSKALVADDPSVRRAGLAGLAVAPDASAVPQIARMLEEEKEDDLRLEEVRALAASDDPLAAEPLRSALEAAPRASESLRAKIALACVDGIARSNDRSAGASLVRALGLGLGYQVDRGVAGGLSRIPDLGIDPRERLREIVVDKKLGEATRACAAWTLALRGEDGPLAMLVGLAKSNERAVRAAVASLLGEGKLDGAVPVLLALAGDQEAVVRRAAAIALGKSEDSTAGAALVSAGALSQDKDPLVRRAYALAFQDALPQSTLDRAQYKDVARLMARALETEFPDATLEERRAQAGTLARLGERAGLLRITGAAVLTTAPPPESRRAAIEALALLGRHHDASADTIEETLLAIVKDPIVGDDAALAIAQIRHETFFEPRWRALFAPAVPFH
jgi:HEAT repeat protein